MVLSIIGEHPLARDPGGKLKSRIGTLFPGTGALVTLPGIHATQRLTYIAKLNRVRLDNGQPRLTRQEECSVWTRAVDLIMEDDAILIRPDPDQMHLAFLADELLQDLIPKHKIRFLYVLNEKVRGAIKRRGECWRINPLPKSVAQMEQMIASSRIGISGREIYYYNRASGTRFLTFSGFTRLAVFTDEELRDHLLEIQEFSDRVSARGQPEVDFFMAGESFSKANFGAYDFRDLDSDALWGAYRELTQQFRRTVPAEYRWDDLRNVAWRGRMFASLVGQDGEVVAEEMLMGLSPEFFMRIQWLPGGRIEDGELIFDSAFEHSSHPQLRRLCDENSRGFIFNLVREHGDLEYVNIGRVNESLSYRRPGNGRRDVYIAEFKQKNADRETVVIIRMQKWGVREHLDEGKGLSDAVAASDDYTEYVLDRRLACRQLGMSLPARATARKISEKYRGAQTQLNETVIWSPYFERQYIPGIATDKIPVHRFEDEPFALEFARLLGEAAATNMIVGRCDRQGGILFDDGDEVLVEDAARRPRKIVVADQTGNFVDYLGELTRVAPDYADPINRRAEYVPDFKAFAQAYLDALVRQFTSTQDEYRRRRKAFDALFEHRPRDENGSIAFRWEKVLERLDRSDPHRLEALIRERLNVGSAM